MSEFRLNNIIVIQDILMRESNNRKNCYKKYKLFNTIVNVFGMGVSGLSIISGAGAAATLSAIITVPLAGGLSCLSAVSGLLAIGSRTINIKLNRKCDKHYKIATLATFKKNSIDLLLSSSLVDNKISKLENNFGKIDELIISEMREYESEKNKIRLKSRAKMPKIFDTDWDKFSYEKINFETVK